MTQEKIDIAKQLDYHVSYLVSLPLIKRRQAKKHAIEIRNLIDRLLVLSDNPSHYPPDNPNIPLDGDLELMSLSMKDR